MEEMQKRQNHQEKRSMIRTTMEQCGNTPEDTEEPKTPTENIGICRICRCPRNTPRAAERHRETQTNPGQLWKTMKTEKMWRLRKTAETEKTAKDCERLRKTVGTAENCENCGKL